MFNYSFVYNIEYHCDDHDNPADFFLDIISHSESQNGRSIMH